jgi:hypothetical protein
MKPWPILMLMFETTGAVKSRSIGDVMLVQLHWQYRNGKTEMKAQREINNQEEMRTFVKETQEEYPLPNRHVMWMTCNEKSEYFIWAAAD